MKRPIDLETLDGIIIDCNKYKDADAIITVLSDGLIRVFRAPRAYNPRSKNRLVTLVYCRLHLEIGGFKEHPEITSASLIEDNSSIVHDLSLHAALSVVREILIKLFREEDHFDSRYFDAMLGLKDVAKETLVFALLVTMLRAFKDLGIISLEPKCSSCYSDEAIYTYDFYKGGLLCRDCAAELGANYEDKDKLTILYFAYKVKPDQLTDRHPDLLLTLEVIHQLLHYLEESMGTRLNSFTNFEKWYLNI